MPSRETSIVLSIFVLILTLSGCSVLEFGKELPLSLSGAIKTKASATEQSHRPSIQQELPVPFPEIHVELTPEVKKELNLFVGPSKTYIVRALARRELYLEPLVKIMEEEGLPVDLLNVALIESGFDPKARSPAGAMGMWQFMKGTARAYGLKVNGSVDQRKDPILATRAAARYFKDLYNNYDNWYLALAAYNAGDGAINRAITRSKRKDFWELSRKGVLKKETSCFVPRFLAATLLVNNSDLTELKYYFD